MLQEKNVYRIGNRRELYVTNWKRFQRKQWWPTGVPSGGEGCRAVAPLPKTKFKKKHRFCRHDNIKVWGDLRFSIND